MKNLKTYEEFDWLYMLSLLIRPVIGWFIGRFIGKIIVKYLKYRQKKNFFQTMMTGVDKKGRLSNYPGLYTNHEWKIEEKGDEIKLTCEDPSGNLAFEFTINKHTRMFNYPSRDYPLKVKISQQDLQQIIDGVEFAKLVQSSIDESFYELSDLGYNVKLYAIDFWKKSFEVMVKSDNNVLSLDKMGVPLEDVLYRIINNHDVVINKNYVKSRHFDYYQSITEYKDGRFKLTNGDVYEVQDGKGKLIKRGNVRPPGYEDFVARDETEEYSDEQWLYHRDQLTFRGLIIPFIKK